jgi:hypothetical protein
MFYPFVIGVVEQFKYSIFAHDIDQPLHRLPGLLLTIWETVCGLSDLASAPRIFQPALLSLKAA